jgi:predicted nucleic acid-binding protein
MFVFDSSTLILIAKIEVLDIFLDEIAMDVTIPKAVERECCESKITLDALVIQKAIHESRIKVASVKNQALAAKLRGDFRLGIGEAEAIALATLEKTLLLGIGDKSGINVCKLLGISFTTAVGILVRSGEKRLISRSGALAKLAELAKHGRYKKSIIEDARVRLEEQPSPKL